MADLPWGYPEAAALGKKEMTALAAVVHADAFILPFCDGSFDVVIADPPYDIRSHGSKKTGLPFGKTGYIPYTGHDWWAEAWRVLRPTGHLYVVTIIREMIDWLREIRETPSDVICWHQPNQASFGGMLARQNGGRSKVWRPILHWEKSFAARLRWDNYEPEDIRIVKRKRNKGAPSGFCEPNLFTASQIQRFQHEALPWPNQLPLKLLRWLLRPHMGTRILDLFSGTGTTRAACIELGLSVISVELSSQALRIISGRAAQMGLEGVR